MLLFLVPLPLSQPHPPCVGDLDEGEEQDVEEVDETDYARQQQEEDDEARMQLRGGGERGPWGTDIAGESRVFRAPFLKLPDTHCTIPFVFAGAVRSAIAQAFRSEEVATAMAAAFLQRGPPPRPRGRPSTASATSECKSASSVISPFKDDEEACRRALRHVMDTVTVRLGLFWNFHGLFLSFRSLFWSFYSWFLSLHPV